jgi:hypothetical protein
MPTPFRPRDLLVDASEFGLADDPAWSMLTEETKWRVHFAQTQHNVALEVRRIVGLRSELEVACKEIDEPVHEIRKKLRGYKTMTLLDVVKLRALAERSELYVWSNRQADPWP